MLRQLRLDAGLNQGELAARLGRWQSFVSKYESGERRLDVLELRDICLACGATLTSFTRRLERALAPARAAEAGGPYRTRARSRRR